MTRRLERAAGGGGGGFVPAGGGATDVTGGAPAPGGGAPALDRGMLNVANRAFQAGSWLQAIQSYERLSLPKARPTRTRAPTSRRASTRA